MKHNIGRREFLKQSVFSAATALAASSVDVLAANREKSVRASSPKKIIVAGGGIGGLCCAYELMKRGHEVVVLEASQRAGGHVRTIYDPLADGLYADAGAEHFTKPGYDFYWNYTKEFNLTALPYPRRDNIIRWVQGKPYTEEMLADRKILSEFGFNQREINYLAHNPWWSLPALYFTPYIQSFENEYRPFNARLNHLDQMPLIDLLKKDQASAAAIDFIGDSKSSALHVIWHAAILKLRGVPLWPPKVFRLKGGNQIMTDTFAAKLTERVRLGCPVTNIAHGKTGVKVEYRERGRDKKIDADYLVSGMSLLMLRKVPIAPAWPEAKAFVVHNMPYYMMTRVVFQSRTPFWEKDKVSPNIEHGDESLIDVWRMAEDVETPRGLLIGNASARTTSEEALAAFRKMYPGKSENIEQALVVNWANDPWARACETVHYPPNWLTRIWPNVIEPHGRIHFVGAYADNLNWGMEAATRSANRVAKMIDEA
ncbi:MAG: FAD-dependent oxidoreductase [Pyrinomonadaceae bacterium]|nr:FAD-dependent oxidoreductase [Pyrinomonadaceae bacterium]